MAWEAALDRDPKDPAALFGLGVHLFEQEFYEDSRDAALPRRRGWTRERPVKDRKQARMLIGIIQNYDRKYAEAESVLKEGLALRARHRVRPKMLFVLARALRGLEQEGAARGVAADR